MSIGANDCDWDEIELTKRLWTPATTDGEESGADTARPAASGGAAHTTS